MKMDSPVFCESWRVPLGPLNGIDCVTGHCLNRFVERTGTKGTAAQVLLKLENWIRVARRGELKEEAEFQKILNHGTLAEYWIVGNRSKGQHWVLVVVKKCLTTIHSGASGEWRIKA